MTGEGLEQERSTREHPRAVVAHGRSGMHASVTAEVERLLREEDVHRALAFLNGRTRFRFTGIYRPVPPLLHNLHLHDRENPTLNLSGGVAILDDTFCALVCGSGAPVAIPDAGADPRYASHPSRDTVLSYVGVPIRDPSGVVWGSLCHFDSRPRLVPPLEVMVLEQVAPSFARALTARGRAAPPRSRAR